MNSINFKKIECKLISQLTMKESWNNSQVDVNYTNQEGKSLLHFACEHGLEDLCSTLIKLGTNVNIIDSCGTTPLMVACKMGYSRIVDSLLLAGADPTKCNNYGVDLLAMTLASEENGIFVKMKEITKNVYYNSILGRITIIHIASALGKTDYLNILFKMCPNYINFPVEKSGMTPLMLAVSGSFPLAVGTLLDNGVDKTIMNTYSMSALHIAKSLGNLKIEKMLDPLLKTKPLTPQLIPDIKVLPASTIVNDFDGTFPMRNTEMNNRLSDKVKFKHPLTPNICISPKVKCNTSKSTNPKGFFRLKNFRRRSRSVESKTLNYNEPCANKDILEYILISTKLYECWPLFKSHEINFKTFLTMNDDDLKSIGILKSSLRSKILKHIASITAAYILSHYCKLNYKSIYRYFVFFG